MSRSLVVSNNVHMINLQSNGCLITYNFFLFNDMKGREESHSKDSRREVEPSCKIHGTIFQMYPRLCLALLIRQCFFCDVPQNWYLFPG